MTEADYPEYLRAAYTAGLNSRDHSTQNGALLVDPVTGKVVAAGWNDLHPTWADTPDRRGRPKKYEWTEHAERSAILGAAKNGVRTAGLWMFCPWFACSDCGRAIVFAGITRVVGHAAPQHETQANWAASIATADQMLREAGVEFLRVPVRLVVRFRFAGQEIEV